MSQALILTALQAGPKTVASLADLTGSEPRSVARSCSNLINQGKIVRVDGGSGRGSIAVYAASGSAIEQAKGEARAPARLQYPVGRDPEHPGHIVHRDPCFYCGARGDIPCKHDRRLS